MKIKITEIEKIPQKYEIRGNSEDYPELAETGVFGEINLKFSVTQAGNKFWLSGEVVGSINQECSKCGSDLKGKFRIPVTIFAEPVEGKEVIWDEENPDSFDDYYVRYGKDVQEISIISMIREQILINCSPFPDDSIKLEECENCKSFNYKNFLTKEKKSIDPRWQKLEELLNKKKN